MLSPTAQHCPRAPGGVENHDTLDDKRPPSQTVDELNASIAACAEAFPHIDVREIQRLLLDNRKSVHLADVVGNILVDGRLLPAPVARPAAARRDGPLRLEARHRLRSEEYKVSVERLLKDEFGSLRKSAVRAVLAENNHSYTDSRATLVALSRKSWRVTLSSWWHRRPPPDDVPHAVDGIASGCAELDEEVFGLLAPVRAAAAAKDRVVAERVDAEQYDELFECGCCYDRATWEHMAACTAGHLVCHQCLSRAAQTSNTGSVPCLSAETDEDCAAHIPRLALELALPRNVLHGFDERFARVSLAQSGIAVVSCPFCPFAAYEQTPCWKFNRRALLSLSLVCGIVLVEMLPLSISFAYGSLVALACAMPLPGDIQRTIGLWLGAEDAAQMLAAKRRGTRFVCRNPACSMGSCVICNKAWPPMTRHNCLEDDKEKLRLLVELAMADAVKRICPQCRCAFVKEGGCNSMACKCGYRMCYRCRADIRGEGYKHFCEHFRPLGGGCVTCTRCSLWGDPDDQAAARAAAERTRREFITSHGDPARLAQRGGDGVISTPAFAGFAGSLLPELAASASSFFRKEWVWERLIDLCGDGQ